MASANVTRLGLGALRQKVLLLVATGAVLLTLGAVLSCQRAPSIAEYPPFIHVPRGTDMERVPLILIGTVVTSSDVGKPRPSKWDSRFLTKLSKVTVSVENVLQGSVGQQQIQIYYFVIASGHDGNRLLGDWKPGERDLFFLQEDSGTLRTICDNYRYCVTTVLTGAHPQWKRDPALPIADDIMNILLNRGEGCDDTTMVEALDHAVQYDFDGQLQERGVIQAVERVAIRETPAVQQSACKLLAYLGDVYPKHSVGDVQPPSLRSACGSTLKEE